PRPRSTSNAMNKATASRVADLQSTAVNQVLREARAVPGAVSLMRGQPDTPTVGAIVEAAVRALRDGRTGYPGNQGEPNLRAAVAEKLARDNGLSYDPGNEILITDGATCGLALALGVLLNPGDEVLLPNPVYDAYASPVRLWGGRPVGFRTTVREARFYF